MTVKELQNYPRGQYTILRVNGEKYDVHEKPTLRKLEKEIGCECIDTIILDKKNMTVMIVDDTGMIDKKPVNAAATALMWQVFSDHYPYSIHGDVAIVNDEDFA